MDELLAVCDQCKLKRRIAIGACHEAFLQNHAHCNFTGCRVVRADFPCPDRVRDYELTGPPAPEGSVNG